MVKLKYPQMKKDDSCSVLVKTKLKQTWGIFQFNEHKEHVDHDIVRTDENT